MTSNQYVMVEHGDLLELQQSAEAWAGALRKGVAVATGEAAEQAADRIDQAIRRTRAASRTHEWNPDGIPPIFEVFSIVRASADELFTVAAEQESELVGQIARNLRDIGDYDEPLILLIQGKIDGTLTPENHTLLAYMAGEGTV